MLFRFTGWSPVRDLSVRLAAIDNKENINREPAAAVGPSLGTGGALVAENGQSKDGASEEGAAGSQHSRGNAPSMRSGGGIKIPSERV